MSEYEYNEELAEKLTRITDRIKWILEHYPSARNSDTLLEFVYLRIFEGIDIPYISWERLSQISMESITRCRRKLNEKGLYLPTDPEVLRKRNRLEEDYRKIMGGNVI